MLAMSLQQSALDLHLPKDHAAHAQQQQQRPMRVRMRTSSTCVVQSHGSEQPRKQPSFGICFDVDGVIARGTVAIPAAAEAFKRLVNEDGEMQVPVIFITNSLSKKVDRANQLSGFLGVKVRPDQMIMAPGPLEVFTPLHDKLCLVVGQGKILDIAAELGFTNMCTIEDIARACPLLDVVDHDNRRRNESLAGCEETILQRVEAIVLMGEPKRWESALQILMDILRTDGQPHQTCHSSLPSEHIPVIACNMDLEFKDRAATPRFGHGAFLACLESLYEKLTGHPLQYTALVGKPSEITFRYAEHVLTKERHRLGYTQPITTMYLIGDTPEVDIAGSNLYQEYVDRLAARRRNNAHLDSASPDWAELERMDRTLPESRNVPLGAQFLPQTVDTVVPVLVCTGVYRPGVDEQPPAGRPAEGGAVRECHHGHRDFPANSELVKPAATCDDVSTAVDYILRQESWS